MTKSYPYAGLVMRFQDDDMLIAYVSGPPHVSSKDRDEWAYDGHQLWRRTGGQMKFHIVKRLDADPDILTTLARLLLRHREGYRTDYVSGLEIKNGVRNA